MSLTQQERRACTILSEIFLDKEHTTSDIEHLSSSLRPLGIPVPALERILRHDVFPVLYPNLLNGVGEWVGFDNDWLIQKVESRRSAGSGWIKGGADVLAWHSIGTYAVWPVWVKVKEALSTDGPEPRL